MKLVKPSLRYRGSFWRGLGALRRENKKAFSEFGEFKTAADYVRLASDHAKGKNLPKDWIPYFTLWAIVDGAVVGQVQLRPGLTKFLREVGGQIGYAVFPQFRRRGYGKQMLVLTLKQVKKLGLKKMVITCDENNIGSKKIIEANGGVLEKKNDMGRKIPKKLVYWLHVN